MSSKNYDALLAKTQAQIHRALARLETSHKKSAKLATDADGLSDDDLETWEGLLSRFARVTDLFTSKYLRLVVQKNEPGFRGTTRDVLDQSEKMGLIESADEWAALRELRNRQAHEYEEETLAELFESVRKQVPVLLKLRQKLPKGK